MENIEKRILQFGELSTEGRRAVEAYVEAHPEWQGLLDDVRALEALRDEMRLLHEGNDEALAYYVVAQHFGIDVSAPLQRVFERLEARLSRDEALRNRYDELARRLADLVAALDPLAQFEELSGFRLVEEEQAQRTGRAPARASRSTNGQFTGGFWRIQAVQWAFAVVIGVVGLYGGLFGISHLTQSDVDRLALVDLSETEIEGYRVATRGERADEDSLSTEGLYLRALYTLREAQTTTLGLFPRYDQGKLDEAERLLERVIEREEARSFLQLEAYFFLGKVHLAQGEIEAARSDFQTVAVCEGRRTPEAVKILTELQEVYPAHEQRGHVMG